MGGFPTVLDRFDGVHVAGVAPPVGHHLPGGCGRDPFEVVQGRPQRLSRRLGRAVGGTGVGVSHQAAVYFSKTR